LDDGGTFGSELGWADFVVCGVGPVGVVVTPPVLDQHDGFGKVVEVAAVEELVTKRGC
jgi:hypothetical protein